MATHGDNIVYIPLCGIAACEKKLKEIAAFVTKCTTKHGIGGSYPGWFERHFKDHDFTVIHYCPTLWKKARLFEKELEEHDSKIILLNLDFDEVKEIASKTSLSDLECITRLFAKFGSEHIISNNDDLLSFADSVKEECILKRTCGYDDSGILSQIDGGFWQSEDTVDGVLDGSSDDQSEKSGGYPLGKVDKKPPSEYDVPDESVVCNPNRDELIRYPDIFGQVDQQPVFVVNSYVCDSNNLNLHIYDPEDFSASGRNVTAVNKDLPPEMITSNNMFILLKVLPEIYRKKDLPALASICTCKNTVLQKRALVLLEICMWEGMKCRPEQELQSLIDTEENLAAAMKGLKNAYLSSQDVLHLALFERASNIYLMVISAIIMCSRHNSDVAEMCNNYLKKIRNRPHDSPSKSKDTLTECSNKVNRFVAGTKGFLIVKNVAVSVIQKLVNDEKLISKHARDLTSKTFIVQVVVTFEILRKIFEPESDDNSIKFLHHYLAVQKAYKKILMKDPEPICIVMVFRALTLFLKYHLPLHFAHMNVRYLCRIIIDVLSVASQRELPDEVGRSLHSLVFHQNPEVRKGIAKILDERKTYSSTHVLYSQNEIVGTLDPLLNVHGKSRKRVIDFTNSEWQTLSCMFGSENVVLCYHIMSMKKCHDDSKAALEYHKDINFNEMNCLLHLRHKNIVQLFAYQKLRVPLFYIIEDCSQNLQTVMQNYRSSGNYFSHLELGQFLLDAVSALEYCHDRNFIHRNLTAQCLAYSQNKSVKLGSFGLCLDLKDSSNNIDFNSVNNIPFRWSAPESLFHSEFSKASDIWMVGILIYEVMTHGVLPFSSSTMSDIALGCEFKEKRVRLNIERCIDDVMSHVIAECTAFEPESRPYIANVKTRIEEAIQEPTFNQRTIDQYPYPKLEEDERRKSILFNRGVPKALRTASVIGEIFQKEKLYISDILVKTKYNDVDVFYEAVLRSMPPSMLSVFNSDELKSVVTHVIKPVLSKESKQHLIMFAPPSDSLLSKIQIGEFNSLQTVLEVIYQVAVILSKIARMDLILGDFYPSSIYVDRENYRKVYIMSLAFMKRPDDDEYSSYNDDPPNIPEFIIPRAAPELIRENNFTSKTDVYCFGSFMWETLAAFAFCSSSLFVTPMPSLFSNKPTSEIKSAVLKNEWEIYNPCPRGCPDKIYQLIKSCVSTFKVERPTMSHVVIKLKEYYQELYNVALEEFSPATPEMLSDNTPMSEGVYLTECNPSISSRDPSSFGAPSLTEKQLGDIISSLEETYSTATSSEASDDSYAFTKKYVDVDYITRQLSSPKEATKGDPTYWTLLKVQEDYSDDQNVYSSCVYQPQSDGGSEEDYESLEDVAITHYEPIEIAEALPVPQPPTPPTSNATDHVSRL